MKKIILVLIALIILCIFAMFFLLQCRKQLDSASHFKPQINRERLECIETLKSFQERGFINDGTRDMVLESMNEKQNQTIIDTRNETRFGFKITIGAIVICLLAILIALKTR